MAQTVDSVVCSFPPELIEMVLKDIPILDLMIAASSMPSTWRAVIENSKNVSRRIKNHYWPDKERATVEIARREGFDRYGYIHPRPKPEDFAVVQRNSSFVFKYVLPNMGTLYIHRRCEGKAPAEAFFFSPAAAPSTVVTLDPATKNIQYTAGPRFGHGFVDLRDCEGLLRFTKGISTSERDLLFNYVVTFYGGEECDENGLLRDAKKVDKGVGTATKHIGVAGNGATTGESGGLRRSGRMVKKTEKGESLTTK